MLAQHANEKYRAFLAGLVPTTRLPLMGIRLPELRQIAKSIVNDRENATRWQEEIAHDNGDFEDIFFEETMLRGMLIGYGTAKKSFSYEEGIAYLKTFVSHIDNWSVCDSFCNSFTFANRYRDKVWEVVQSYLYSDREYEVRVALILLLSQYLKYDVNNDKISRNKQISMSALSDTASNQKRSAQTKVQYPYLDKILDVLNRKFIQGYYAQMAAAWLMAESFVCFPYESNRLLAGNCQMDTWTYNKALQKIRESKNPNQSVKEYMKSLKK